MTPPPAPDFDSPEGLALLLKAAPSRLHFINRVSGESNFTAQLANLIETAGDMAGLIDDPETRKAFGDGWTPGRLDAAAQRARIVDLLTARLGG